jgi:hypothetical protein
MLKLLQAFWIIATLRAGPQDLPVSGFLAVLAGALYALASLLVGMVYLPPLAAVLSATLDLGLLSAAAVVALRLRGFPERVPQTLAGLLGSLALIGFLALPVVLWALTAQDMGQELGPGGARPPVAAALLLRAFVVWNLLVIGHVLRHALAIPFALGVLASLAYFLVYVQVDAALFASTMG